MASKVITLLSLTAPTVDAAGTLSLTWDDCGDASTHGKVTGLTPTSLTLGQNTHTVGTGSLNEAVTGGSFTIDLTAGIIKKTWTGDLCTKEAFQLPLSTGTITWDGMGCPLASGNTNVPLDIQLSSEIPSVLLKTKITVQATSTNGDKLLCMNINTAPASVLTNDDAPNDACSWGTKCMNSENVCATCNASPFKGDDRCVCGPASSDWIHKDECKACDKELEATPGPNAASLALNWKDCGDASTHGKVSNLSPKTLTLGQVTLTTGTGTVNEAVQGGNFAIDMKAGLISQHWTGDLCAAKTFNLPLSAGNVTWKGLKCPLTSGSVSVPLDIYLSSALPSFLTKSTISVGATASSGDKLLCMEIDTVPAPSATAEIVV